MGALHLNFLGPLKVEFEDGPVAGLRADKARALLVYLAVESAQSHSREFLATLLWPEQPLSKALHNLRQALLEVKKALDDPVENGGCEYLLVSAKTIQFNSESDFSLDVARFEQAAVQAARNCANVEQCPRLNVRRLQAALLEFHGPFLERFFLADSSGFEEWALLKREALNRLAAQAYEALTNYHERRGEYAAAREAALRLLTLTPWAEVVHCQIMRLFAVERQWRSAEAQYFQCRRYLGEFLDSAPAPETSALYEDIRRFSAVGLPYPPRWPAARHNLPVFTTPFIGRQAELDQIADWLSNPGCRLLTLVGAGGMGKTWLAIEAAREQIGLYPNGVYFVPLLRLQSPDLLLPTIAESLGLHVTPGGDPAAQAARVLRPRQALVILDNFEHLLAGADRLANLLEDAPGLVILVTSRWRTGLKAEWLLPVGGLSYPMSAVLAPGEAALEQYDSGRMLLGRLQTQRPGFAPSAEQDRSLRRICQLVEGMPLGIELAAAALWETPIEAAALSIAHNLDGLATGAPDMPPQHRSIRAVFQSAWDLIRPDERRACQRLSVFQSSFTIQAAWQAAGVSPDMLAALAAKSLLRKDSEGHYSMHELLRQFTAELLAQEPHEKLLADANHALFYEAFFVRHADELARASDPQTLALARMARPNIHKAWRWAWEYAQYPVLDHSLEGLFALFNSQGYFLEGVELFSAALAQPGLPERLRARILARRGALAFRTGQSDQVKNDISQALDAFRAWNWMDEWIVCQVRLADVLRKRGEVQQAHGLAQEALTLARAARHLWGEAGALHLLGRLTFADGEVEDSIQFLESGAQAARASQQERLIARLVNSLAVVACHVGKFDQAMQSFAECLEISRRVNDGFGIALQLNNLGTIYHLNQDYERAGAAFRESLEICRQIGDLEGQALALSNLGDTAVSTGDYAAALGYNQQGVLLSRAAQDLWMEMVCLNNLGEVYICLENDQAAWEYLEESLLIEEKVNDQTILMKIFLNFGRALIVRGRSEIGAALLQFVCDQPAAELEVQQAAAEHLRRLNLPAARIKQLQPADVRRLLAEVH